MSRQQALLETLVALADTLDADYDPAEHLHMLADHCVEALDAAAAGVLLSNGPQLEVAAASSREVRVLELFEALQREGPCVDAFERGVPVRECDLSGSAKRWPGFAPQAIELGYRCVYARPMARGGERIGALNVFWSDATCIDPAGEVVAKNLADMATIGILHERALSAANEQILRLRRAQDQRAVVEQAKTLLAERLAVEPDEAYDWLRRYARDRNQRLRDVSQRFINGELGEHHFAPE